MKFAYRYSVKDARTRFDDAAPEHPAYWRSLDLAACAADRLA
jgi:hypothetical protein